MKKSLLLLASMLVSAASFAQWTKPANPTGIDLTIGDTIYLYNAEAGGFFVGANDWSTRASVGPNGYKVIIKEAHEDNEDPTSALTGTYWLCDSVETQKEVKATFADNAQSIWVDNVAGAHVDEWLFTKLPDGTYNFMNKGVNEAWTLGVSEKYEGKTGNTRLWLHDTSLTYKYEVEGEELEAPIFDGAWWDKWTVISKDEYATFQPKLAAYLAAVSLGSALETAKADYPRCDFSKQEEVYKNTNSTADELKEAESMIKVIITEYKASLASFDEPLDMTENIGDGSSVDPWTRTFTGEGEVGSHSTNTWSTEADGGADGTDMTTPFIEHWTGSGGILSDQKIYQTLKDCAPGLYKFTADVRAYSEAGGIDSFAGLSMYFGDKSVDLQTQADMFKSGSKCVLWSKSYFSIIAIVEESGDIELGFDIKGANFNWLAFKNTSLTYYGKENVEENYLKIVKSAYSYDEYTAEDANADVIAAYNDAVKTLAAAETEDAIKDAAKTVEVALTALEENKAAYAAYFEKTEEVKAFMNEHSLSSESADILADYTMDDNPEEPAEGDYNGNGNYDYIKASYNLDTEAITAETAWVTETFKQAFTELFQPGFECTEIIINPNFADPNGKGWTKASGNGVNSNLALTGGIIPGLPVAESWHSHFDIYQEITGVPDGVYQLSLNGFCRIDDGAADVTAELYMNEFVSPLQNILEDALPKDEAIDGFNCYLSNGAQSAAIMSNPIFADNHRQSPADNTDSQTSEGAYYPNGMEGASVAFSADRYKAIAQGYVSGGKLTIGVRNYGSLNQWALWGNFRLTYLGTGADAVYQMMQPAYNALSEYIAKNEDVLTAPAMAAAQAVIDEADAAVKKYDEAEMTAAIVDLGAGLTAAKANVAAKNAYTNASDELDATVEEFEKTASQKAMEAYKAVDAKRAGVNDLTTEEVEALTEEITSVITALKIPATDDASDENPVDMTAVIVNSTFDTIGDFTGWSGSGFGAGGTTSTNAERYNMAYDTYQDIEGLPAGTYAVTVQGFYRQGAATDDYKNMSDGGTPAYNASLYAVGENGTEASAPIMSITTGAIPADETKGGSTAAVGTGLVVPNSMEAANNWFEAGFYLPTDDFNTVIVKVGEDGKLRIGVKKSETLNTDWSIFDNFKLTYFGTNSSKQPSAIEAINGSSSVAPAGIYTISGAKVANLQKGINIVKMADGSVKKVLVK